MNFTFMHAADVHLDMPLRGIERRAVSLRIRLKAPPRTTMKQGCPEAAVVGLEHMQALVLLEAEDDG